MSSQTLSTSSPSRPKSKAWLIVLAMAKGLVKSLSISAIVMAPGFLLLIAGHAIPGMILLFLGSFCLMAWTYRRPWRLGWITCWIPPLAASVSYLIQFVLFSDRMPSLGIVVFAAAFGALVGLVRASTHQVYFDSGQIKAKRTFGYLIIWIVSYVATQVFATLGRNMLAHAGLITGAFATAMLGVVSIFIFAKFLRAKSGIVNAELK